MIVRVRLSSKRRGITLLEVVVALAIFLMSLVAIMQLVSIGTDRAQDAQLTHRASMLCQRELNKRIAGIEPLGGTSATLPNEPEWQCDVEVSDAEITGLKKVKVTVRRELENGRVTEASLAQLVLDPSLRGSTQDVPSGTTPPSTETAPEPSTDTAGGNSQGGNNQGGNNNGGGNNKSGGNTKSGGNGKSGGNARPGGGPKTGGPGTGGPGIGGPGTGGRPPGGGFGAPGAGTGFGGGFGGPGGTKGKGP